MDELDTFTRLALEEEKNLRGRVQSHLDMVKQGASKYIMNSTSEVVHKSHRDGVTLPPLLWTTVCGWKFAKAPFTRLLEEPSAEAVLCDRCFARGLT